jgi:hypothetical protein
VKGSASGMALFLRDATRSRHDLVGWHIEALVHFGEFEIALHMFRISLGVGFVFRVLAGVLRKSQS